MIVVTGGSGFIGKNILSKCKNYDRVLNVDFIKSEQYETMDPYNFIENLEKKDDFIKSVKIIFHNGACSDTTNDDLVYMMENNLKYSMRLLDACYKNNIRLIYASSASVYGDGPFTEKAAMRPKNIYAKTKSLFDLYAKSFIEASTSPQIVGLRYFNVYGKYEEHKKDMSSVIYKFFNQKRNGGINLFENSEEYFRDFIHVDDVVDITRSVIAIEIIMNIK